MTKKLTHIGGPCIGNKVEALGIVEAMFDNLLSHQEILGQQIEFVTKHANYANPNQGPGRIEPDTTTEITQDILDKTRAYAGSVTSNSIDAGNLSARLLDKMDEIRYNKGEEALARTLYARPFNARKFARDHGLVKQTRKEGLEIC